MCGYCSSTFPSQGWACRGQGENNCNDFRRELLLARRQLNPRNLASIQRMLHHMQTNHKNIRKVILLTFCRDLRVWGVSRRSSEAILQKMPKKVPSRKAEDLCFGTLCSTRLAQKLDVLLLFSVTLCLCLASFLGGFRYRFGRIFVYSKVHLVVIWEFCLQMRFDLAKCLFFEMLGLRRCIILRLFRSLFMLLSRQHILPDLGGFESPKRVSLC